MSDTNHYRNPAAGAGGALVLTMCLIRLFFPGCGKSGQDLASYEIAQAGGRIQVDENAPDKPVVRVDFDGSRKTGLLTFAPLGDEGLAYVRPFLEGLPRLRYLRIASMAMISDSGLSNQERFPSPLVPTPNPIRSLYPGYPHVNTQTTSSTADRTHNDESRPPACRVCHCVIRVREEQGRNTG
jgi:hypothetical protein